MRRHFQLDGYVNTQNCRFWGAENPRATHEKPLHAQRATVWSGFCAGWVIGPYFFESEPGNAVTVNGVRYHNMITEFLWPQLMVWIWKTWFQQDGATCHSVREITELLQDKISWPCHLTQCRSGVATEVVRFDTVRLLSLGVCEISSLCQQTTNNSWAQGGDSTCHWRNWAAIMRNCRWQFRQKSKSMPAESWGTFVGYCVNRSVCVLYTEIKISALSE